MRAACQSAVFFEDFGRRDLVALDFADIIGVLREMLNGTACDVAGKLDGLYFVKFLDRQVYGSPACVTRWGSVSRLVANSRAV